MNKYKRRRFGAVLVLLIAVLMAVVTTTSHSENDSRAPSVIVSEPSVTSPALSALDTLVVKGRAPKTGYDRALFYDDWSKINGCDMRNVILHRDLTEVTVNAECQVTHGTLHDPYTGSTITFERGESTSDDVQIDHVVALSDAWQKGAQDLSADQRHQLANDPLELLAVDGKTNQQKGDGDAATWLPPSKAFRCEYVARQIAVKQKYLLWITAAERDAMKGVLSSCPDQRLPSQ
ncbi:MAG: uncharacterized protein JWN33_362 [Candidatus Saccharibacteria bacterium]|nr:uncharacterized protein [Candidatus Saccharibacteria bacterium]